MEKDSRRVGSRRVVYIGAIVIPVVILITVLPFSSARTDEEKDRVLELIERLKDEDEDVRRNAAEALVKIGEPAVEPLIKVLKDKNAKVRGDAAYALGRIGDKRAVDALIEVLRNEDDDALVRLSAAEALIRIGEPAVEPLIEALKDEDEDARSFAADALGEIGDRRAVDALVKILKDGSAEVRESAACALGKIGDEKALPHLELIWEKEESKEVKVWVAYALFRIAKKEGTFEFLLDVLKDRDREVRWQAVLALGGTGDKRAVEPLMGVLKDIGEDMLVRGSAANALVEIGEPAVRPLIKALRDEDVEVRWNAAAALGKIGDRRAVKPLIKALKDDDIIVRLFAAGALGDIGDERAVESLIEELKDEGEDVRRNAAEALEKITGEDFGEEHSKWRNWWQKRKRLE